MGLHLLLGAAVLWSLQPEPAPASWGRRVGALMVRLVTLQPAPKPIAAAPTPVALPAPRVHKAALQPPAQHPPLEPDKPPAPSAQEAQVAREAPVPAPSPAPAASQGARFANLFAPIIARPMGLGQWGAMPRRPEPPMPEQLQQQQRVAARRGQLMQQIQTLQQSMLQQPLKGRCDIRLAILPSQGMVTCAEADDVPRIAGLLSGFLTQGATPLSAPADACFQAELNRVTSAGCVSDSAPKENGPEGPLLH